MRDRESEREREEEREGGESVARKRLRQRNWSRLGSLKSQHPEMASLKAKWKTAETITSTR